MTNLFTKAPYSMSETSDLSARGTSRITRLSDRKTGLCWKTIFAGFLIALLVYWIVTAIGVAFGAMGFASITGDISTISFGTVLWQTTASIVALFVGTFIAVKASYETDLWLSVGEGMVTSSLFFWTMALQVGIMVSGIASRVTTRLEDGAPGIGTRSDVQSLLDGSTSGGLILTSVLVLGTMAACMGGFFATRFNPKGLNQPRGYETERAA